MTLNTKLSNLFAKVNPPNQAPDKNLHNGPITTNKDNTVTTWNNPSTNTFPGFENFKSEIKKKHSKEYVNIRKTRNFNITNAEPKTAFQNLCGIPERQLAISAITAFADNMELQFDHNVYGITKSTKETAYFFRNCTATCGITFESLNDNRMFATTWDLIDWKPKDCNMVIIKGSFTATSISTIFLNFNSTEHFDMTDMLVTETPFRLNQLISMLPFQLYGISLDATKFADSNFQGDIQQLYGINNDARKIKRLIMYTKNNCKPESLKILIQEAHSRLASIPTVTIVTNAPIYTEIAQVMLHSLQFKYKKSVTSSKYGNNENFCVFTKTTRHSSGTVSTFNLAFLSKLK